MHLKIKKFLESQQQAIPGKANLGNTMLGKTIPGNYRKCNSEEKFLGNLRKYNYIQCNYRQSQAKKFESKDFQEIPGKETARKVIIGNTSQSNFRQVILRQFNSMQIQAS